MGVYGSLILRLLLFIRGDGVHKAVAVLRLCKLLLRILYRVLGRLDLRRRRAGAFLLQIRQRFLFIRQILGQSAVTLHDRIAFVILNVFAVFVLLRLLLTIDLIQERIPHIGIGADGITIFVLKGGNIAVLAITVKLGKLLLIIDVGLIQLFVIFLKGVVLLLVGGGSLCQQIFNQLILLRLLFRRQA